MRIAIIGAGHIGSTLARHFAAAGHDVAISNSRGPETLRELAAEAGVRVQAMTAEEAARFGEIVVVAIPFKSYKEVPARDLRGKIVIDANNYYPSRDGHFPELDDDRTTSSELLAAHLPGARVVKAFNTMYWKTLGDAGRPDGGDDRLALFIAGDDQDAKELVSRVVEEIGFTPVDTGSLAEGGRLQQPGSPIYAKDLPAREAAKALGARTR
jgi:8-hydroxy-5-deazaflavin:NADPH oxidoreductase